MSKHNILTFNLAVNQETGTPGWRYHLDMWTGLIRCRCDADKKQVGIKQLYNPVPQTVRVSWSQWEPAPSRGLGPSGHPVEQPSRMRKKCCYSQRNLGPICCSLFSLQLISHTQPFRIKCERYIFVKKCVCSSLLLIMFLHIYICIHIVVSWLYNTFLLKNSSSTV